MISSKAEVRRTVLAARRALPAAQGVLDSARATAEVRRAGRIALYVALGPEPQTGELITWLLSQGKEVLLPILYADNDLGWGLAPRGVALGVSGESERGAVGEGASGAPVGGLVVGRLGLREPPVDLGVDAVATAELVICPAVAVDRRGVRLGRGGGSYDRALARVPDGVPIWAAVYDTEILDTLPADPHDRHVTAALTPTRLVPLG